MLERGAEGLSEKVDTSHTVYTEIRFPLRIEVIQKKGFALEKSYSSDGKMRQKEPIDIILIKDGKRTNIKEYLPEGTTLIESPEIQSSKIRVIKSNIFTKIITIPKDVLIEPDYVEDGTAPLTGEETQRHFSWSSAWSFGHRQLRNWACARASTWLLRLGKIR